MTKKIDEAFEAAADKFPWDEVVVYMRSVGWKWHVPGVPNKNQLRAAAREMFELVKLQEKSSITSYGFTVQISGSKVTLKFTGKPEYIPPPIWRVRETASETPASLVVIGADASSNLSDEDKFRLQAGLLTSDADIICKRLREVGAEALAKRIERESKAFECPACGDKQLPRVGLIMGPDGQIKYVCRKCKEGKIL